MIIEFMNIEKIKEDLYDQDELRSNYKTARYFLAPYDFYNLSSFGVNNNLWDYFLQPFYFYYEIGGIISDKYYEY